MTMAQAEVQHPINRCRLILIMGAHALTHCGDSQLATVLRGGDVASIIFHNDGLEETDFQKLVAPLVTTAQENHIAAIIVEDSRTAGRVNADGLQLGQDSVALGEAIDKFSPKLMIGAGNVKTRHNALVIGELQPDYVMFGKPGGDIRPEPHPKNVDLGSWWSTMVEIPCVVLGGNSVESVIEVSKSGAEFVALGDAIFSPDVEEMIETTAAENIKNANALLDEHAPVFETADD